MIKISKATLEWVVKRTYWRNGMRVRWDLYFVPPRIALQSKYDRPSVWSAKFLSLEHVDLFISQFEPQPTIENPYIMVALAQLKAGEISEAEFTETAQVYGALPNQITAFLNEYCEEKGEHDG